MPPRKSGGMITYQMENQSGLRLLIFVFFLLNPLVNLLPVNGNFFGCIHTQTYLIALDSEHGDTDIVTNNEGFPDATREN